MDSTQRSIHTLQLQLRLKGTCGLDSDEPDRTKAAIDNGQSDPSANLVTNELPTTATEGPSLQSTQGKPKHHLNVRIPNATTTLTRKTSCDRVLGGASRLVLFQQLRPGQRRTCLQQTQSKDLSNLGSYDQWELYKVASLGQFGMNSSPNVEGGLSTGLPATTRH